MPLGLLSEFSDMSRYCAGDDPQCHPTATSRLLTESANSHRLTRRRRSSPYWNELPAKARVSPTDLFLSFNLRVHLHIGSPLM
jgi:hypothetical protein